jgi:hypothetical protein
MTGNEKYLYCTKCEEYPDEVDEVYQGTVTEFRKWDGDEYGLEDSSWPASDTYCHKCGTQIPDIED